MLIYREKNYRKKSKRPSILKCPPRLVKISTHCSPRLWNLLAILPKIKENGVVYCKYTHIVHIHDNKVGLFGGKYITRQYNNESNKSDHSCSRKWGKGLTFENRLKTPIISFRNDIETQFWCFYIVTTWYTHFR